MSYLRKYIPHDSDLRRIWLAANGGKIDDQFCKNVNIHDICKEILGLPDEVPFREIATLMGGVAIIQKLKTEYLNENFEKFQNKLQYAIEGKDSSNMANEEFDFKDVESQPIMTDSDDDLGTGYLSDGSGSAKNAYAEYVGKDLSGLITLIDRHTDDPKLLVNVAVERTDVIYYVQKQRAVPASKVVPALSQALDDDVDPFGYFMFGEDIVYDFDAAVADEETNVNDRVVTMSVNDGTQSPADEIHLNDDDTVGPKISATTEHGTQTHLKDGDEIQRQKTSDQDFYSEALGSQPQWNVPPVTALDDDSDDDVGPFGPNDPSLVPQRSGSSVYKRNKRSRTETYELDHSLRVINTGTSAHTSSPSTRKAAPNSVPLTSNPAPSSFPATSKLFPDSPYDLPTPNDDVENIAEDVFIKNLEAETSIQLNDLLLNYDRTTAVSLFSQAAVLASDGKIKIDRNAETGVVVISKGKNWLM